jgi:hypothetical protein
LHDLPTIEALQVGIASHGVRRCLAPEKPQKRVALLDLFSCSVSASSPHAKGPPWRDSRASSSRALRECFFGVSRASWLTALPSECSSVSRQCHDDEPR